MGMIMIKLFICFLIALPVAAVLALFKEWATVAQIKKESKKANYNNKWVYKIILK